MSNHDILSELSELESALYYRIDGSDDPENVSRENLKTVHDKIDELLHLWHDITGETL